MPSFTRGQLDNDHLGITAADTLDGHLCAGFPENVTGPIDLGLAMILYPQFALEDVAGTGTLMRVQRSLVTGREFHTYDPGLWIGTERG